MSNNLKLPPLDKHYGAYISRNKEAFEESKRTVAELTASVDNLSDKASDSVNDIVAEFLFDSDILTVFEDDHGLQSLTNSIYSLKVNAYLDNFDSLIETTISDRVGDDEDFWFYSEDGLWSVIRQSNNIDVVLILEKNQTLRSYVVDRMKKKIFFFNVTFTNCFAKRTLFVSECKTGDIFKSNVFRRFNTECYDSKLIATFDMKTNKLDSNFEDALSLKSILSSVNEICTSMNCFVDLTK